MKASQSYAVIAVYCLRNPKDEQALRGMLAQHHTCLIHEGLACVRRPQVLKTGNYFLEYVEWKSKESAASAHTNP
jgi:hypothetical protein